MRCFVFCSVICLSLSWTNGKPDGVGAYAFQDSSGNRYGGTYGLDDAHTFKQAGSVPRPFVQNFWENDDFYPEYFNNLENLLKEAFDSNIENQKLAFTAARKAFDLTSNQAGYIPNFPSRFQNFGGFVPFQPFPMPGFNSAFASGSIGPGFTHQIAAISPENPRMPNIDVMNRFAETGSTGNGPKHYSVQTSSISSSSNINGEQKNYRKSESVIDKDGVITRYKIES